jgi:hypothetical protein
VQKIFGFKVDSRALDWALFIQYTTVADIGSHSKCHRFVLENLTISAMRGALEHCQLQHPIGKGGGPSGGTRYQPESDCHILSLLHSSTSYHDPGDPGPSTGFHTAWPPAQKVYLGPLELLLSLTLHFTPGTFPVLLQGDV